MGYNSFVRTQNPPSSYGLVASRLTTYPSSLVGTLCLTRRRRADHGCLRAGGQISAPPVSVLRFQLAALY